MSIRSKRKTWLLNLLLIGVGVGAAFALLLIFFALFPQYRPGAVTFTVRMGDIFFNHPEWVVKPEDPDEVLSIHTLRWDQDGFRIPAWTASRYPIVALGDSFTEAANAAKPWPDVLAATINQPVRNLAFRGYGPVEAAEMLRLYGVNENPETVIYGFFEGNDLSNAVTSQGKPVELPSQIEEFRIIPTDFDSIEVKDPRYPMQVNLAGELQPIAFFEWYVWNLNIEPEALENSQNLAFTVESLRAMRALAPESCLVMAYLPSKPHVYVPYLTPESQVKLMQQAHRNLAEAGEALRTESATDITFEELSANLGNIRDVIRERAEQEGFVFFDLTPILQEAAARGEMVYYVYDTHLNQRGHDLVGEAVAQFLQTDPCNKGA